MGMIRFSWLALIALLTSFVVFGCASNDEDEAGADKGSVTNDNNVTDPNGGEPNGSEGSNGDETSSVGAEMTLASNVYQKDGVAVCPVLGGDISDISTAPVRERDGKTYYFC